MPIEILMPALSPTMTEGKIARWVKKVGDAVRAGDVLAEIETDKATMEVEAVDEGTLAKIVVPEGTENVAVNTPIAVLAGEGEDPKAVAADGGGGTTQGVAAAPQRQVPPEQVVELKGPEQAKRDRPSAPAAVKAPPAGRSGPAPPRCRPYATRCATRWRRRCAAMRPCS